MRHKEPVGTVHQSLLGIALHQADAFQSLNQGATGQGVHHHVRNEGARILSHGLVSSQHDFVNLTLAGIELAAHRCGACEVGGVVVFRLSTGITYHHATLFQNVVVAVIVQRLSVDAQDDGERHGAATRKGQTLNHTRNLLLNHARLAHLHGSSVHIIGCVGGALHLSNFNVALHLAHGDNSLDEFEADILLHLVDMAAEPL